MRLSCAESILYLSRVKGLTDRRRVGLGWRGGGTPIVLSYCGPKGWGGLVRAVGRTRAEARRGWGWWRAGNRAGEWVQ